MNLFSTEQVSKWHPDKACDIISDTILTEILKKDPNAHCGIETMWKNNTIILGGEVSYDKSNGEVDVKEIAMNVSRMLDYYCFNIENYICEQSPEINRAVMAEKNIGAGDQGIMFGYCDATTHTGLPYGFETANSIIHILEMAKYSGFLLKGDAKCQVTVDLCKQGVDSLHTILISVCHEECLHENDVRELITGVIKGNMDIGNAKLIINPSGAWTIGGPAADCGLTGRKIVCDQYGGYVPVGGGAFSGKDPTKVDRSASYAARLIAKDLLINVLCGEYSVEDVLVQLGYAIGIPEPMSVNVRVNGVYDQDMSSYVLRHYDLTPKGIIDRYNLRTLDYGHIAEGCHYRPIEFGGIG